ncbi:hypothetical protein A0H81_10989 [Grifola frondosa]|uniref:T6SS Phospholipase effector Tle1-like catalytic domain-containing protein n=1 Tax=Grifola frondosa TaxID=5627 RepID=A0A1C7M1U7_GRIFR|nr:hypothetical protein A0H81_10989 [Grifola frondosa]
MIRYLCKATVVTRHSLTYYNSGIGTYAKPSKKTLGNWLRVLGHKIDLAIAWNFDRIVKGAYRWLSENYQEGDRIFLFGFSRGAYQVRALAAMINKVGLIRKGNEEQIPFAYELYADPASDAPIPIHFSTKTGGLPEQTQDLILYPPIELILFLSAMAVNCPTVQEDILERRVSSFHWSLGHSVFCWAH